MTVCRRSLKASPLRRRVGGAADQDTPTWERELLALFVRNQLKVALALAAVAIGFFLTNLIWTPPQSVALWLACVLGAQGVQLLLCRQYSRLYTQTITHSEWVGMLTASELLYASCWVVPLFLFWQPGNDMQHIFLIATLMAVVAIRIMIAGNYMPVVITGTGFITLGISPAACSNPRRFTSCWARWR